jgi:uncharacterized protein (TIGR02271 family)
MAKTPLSKSDEYELVDKDRDIRGWKVQDHAGNVLGKVEELIVDTERETVTHIILDNQVQYPIRDIELANDRVVVTAPVPARSAAETVRIDTIAPPVDAQGDMRLQVVEERLRVGKRQVEQGGVRVSTQVTEQPVKAQVTLREEHVDVVRRPVDRSATPAELAGMADRTVDVIERAEVAMVNKESRVVEEVVVKRDVLERSETIRETVRQTDVEVRDIKPAPDVDRNRVP